MGALVGNQNGAIFITTFFTLEVVIFRVSTWGGYFSSLNKSGMNLSTEIESKLELLPLPSSPWTLFETLASLGSIKEEETSSTTKTSSDCDSELKEDGSYACLSSSSIA